MHKQIEFHNRCIDVQLSSSAIEQCNQQMPRLIIEIQVYFSCLLGKRIALYSDQPIDGVWQLEAGQFEEILNESKNLASNLFVRFNTVMTKDCPVSDYAGPPPVTDFTIKNPAPYVPDWLTIDYIHNRWTGEFGWSSSDKNSHNTRVVRSEAKVLET